LSIGEHACLVWDTSFELVSWIEAISPSRKILCSAALLSASLAVVAPPAVAVAGPPAPVRARLSQGGRRLLFSVRTSKPVALTGLSRLPAGSHSPSLCFALALLPADAGLTPQRYRWRVVASRGGCRARRPGACEASLPVSGTRLFRLRPVRAVGCTGGDAGLDTNGPRDRNVVALTFDDGPSEYTPGFLQVLREKHVPATFFEIGEEMSRYPAAMRQILRAGDEIGNHTVHHTEFPGYGEIAPATTLAQSITHFRPCLFRPPGGAVNSAVIGAAAEDGLRTITWDVDPGDWSTPGTSAIYSRVVDAAQAGSIILMHDGGGPRDETLAALPQIIDTLRASGYGFATVTGLLGQRMIFRPYG
jgi:peptidoglycan-N-acetylglucosamine deacetylase